MVVIDINTSIIKYLTYLLLLLLLFILLFINIIAFEINGFDCIKFVLYLIQYQLPFIIFHCFIFDISDGILHTFDWVWTLAY